MALPISDFQRLSIDKIHTVEEKLFSTSKYIAKQPLFFNFEENDLITTQQAWGGPCWELGVFGGENKRR